jgi:hypothetical protein
MDELKYILDKYKIKDIPKHNAPLVLSITREELAVLFSELGYIKGAEIGVEKGYYSEVLCKANPKLHLDSIDAWKSYKGYQDHTNQAKLDSFYTASQKLLAPYDCTLFREFSMDAVKHFADKYFDFVYIDAAHDFLNVTQDIAMWSKKVRLGGIVAGHDYKRDNNPNWNYQVKDVVPAWTYAHRISPWFVTTEYISSWFWVVK